MVAGEDRAAVEAAFRLGDGDALRRVLDKFVRVRKGDYAAGTPQREYLDLMDGHGSIAFVVRGGDNVGAAAALLESVLLNLIAEVLS